jgi:hypothetical protein
MGSVRRREREYHYDGARFGAVARRHFGGKLSAGLGGAGRRYRSTEPEPRSDVSEPAADPAASGTDPADDAVPWSGADAASPPVATPESSAMSEEGTTKFKQYVKSSMKLSYWEMVAVGWRIFWQGIGGFVLTLILGNLVVLSILPELTRTDPSYWALAIPLVGAFMVSLFVLLPLVVRGLITGPFGTFRLVVKRDEPCRSTL